MVQRGLISMVSILVRNSRNKRYAPRDTHAVDVVAKLSKFSGIGNLSSCISCPVVSFRSIRTAVLSESCNGAQSYQRKFYVAGLADEVHSIDALSKELCTVACLFEVSSWC